MIKKTLPTLVSGVSVVPIASVLLPLASPALASLVLASQALAPFAHADSVLEFSGLVEVEAHTTKDYDDNLSSDAALAAIGETRENAIQVDFDLGAFAGSAYLFKGDASHGLDGGDNIKSYGVNLAYAQASFDVGVSYISNIVDTNLLGEIENAVAMDKTVGGVALYANTVVAGIAISGEFITALSDINPNYLNFNDGKSKPAAYGLELGYAVSSKHQVALGFQGTMEMQAAELPQTRLLVSYLFNLNANTAIAFEVLRDIDYATSDSGSGEAQNIATIQIATSF